MFCCQQVQDYHWGRDYYILYSEKIKAHVYLNSVQQMVSGKLAGECLQTGFERHGLPPQRALLDAVYPLREHLNSVLRMVSGGYCEALFPDAVCWTRLRNTWKSSKNAGLHYSMHFPHSAERKAVTAIKIFVVSKEEQHQSLHYID